MTRQPAATECAAPAFVMERPSLIPYWQRVVRPALTGMPDDGLLAVFLNQQIDEWEIVGDQAARAPLNPENKGDIFHAAQIIVLLTDTLAVIRLRIMARIAAAEAHLADSARVAA